MTGDAAEQTFRIVIEETEFVIRIAGSLLKETIAMLYAISKDRWGNIKNQINNGLFRIDNRSVAWREILTIYAVVTF